MHYTVSRLIYITAFLITLTGCGFHLRGTSPIAPSIQNVQVVADNVSARIILPDVIEQLKNAGFNVTNSGPLTLSLKAIKKNEKSITLSTSYEYTEHQQIFTLEWTLLTQNTAPLFETKKITQTRRYTLNSNQQTASQQEALENWQFLQKNVAVSLIRQLIAFKEPQIQNLINQAQKDIDQEQSSAAIEDSTNTKTKQLEQNHPTPSSPAIEDNH